MRLGRYIDGRELSYEESGGVFDIGGAPVTAAQVLEYDDFSQIEWVSPEVRERVRTGQMHSMEPAHEDSSRRGRLLGFRSRHPVKMVVAVIYYASWTVFAVAVMSVRMPYAISGRDILLDHLTGALLAIMAITPALCLSDFGYRNKLPFFKHRKIASSAAGFLVIAGLMVLTAVVVDSFHTSAYQLAAEEQRLAEQQLREAARAQERQEAEARRQREAEARETQAEREEAERLATEAEVARTQAAESLATVGPGKNEYDLGEMTNPELTGNFLKACEEIGIDPGKIKRLKQLPDWASGERYEFVYESSGITVYANADQSISSINLGQVHLFEQGYESLNIADYLVDLVTAMELQVRAEDTVKSALNYPSSAEFSWLEGWGVGRSHSIYFIGGTVSAENAFGVADDASFYIEYEKSDSGFHAKYFRLGNADVIGSGSVVTEEARQETGTASTSGMIALTEGTIGSYGKSKSIDGDQYIWYYVPPGRYIVTAQTNMTKLYLHRNQTIKNYAGWSECVSVTTLDFPDTSQSKELVVGEDQHIELTFRAKVTLTPAE